MNNILTVNGGSSSLKCALFRAGDQSPELLYSFRLSNLSGQATLSIRDSAGHQRKMYQPDFRDVPPADRHQVGFDLVLDWLNEQSPDDAVTAISHRVVHGGEAFTGPVRVTGEILEQLHAFVPLAPLHQPYNLKLIDACRYHLPQLPQIACFDTMFHAGQPARACHYALPRQLTEEGIRRYGFHGLSYEFIQRRLAQLDPQLAARPTIVAHLGAGASMCALRQGRSQASTMGFTAVDGIPMGTRCGSLDPGVMLYLMRHYGMDPDRLEKLIYQESGWLGVSGISSDMQELLASERPEAQEAIDLFTYRAAREIGSLTAALEGLDQLVFTGGVGENSAEIRQRIIDRCRWLGIDLDSSANEAGQSVISSADSRVRVRVIATDEEAMLALHAVDVLSSHNI